MREIHSDNSWNRCRDKQAGMLRLIQRLYKWTYRVRFAKV